MKRKLTPDERKRLVLRHRREKKRKVCDRIKAVLLYDEGYSYSEIARILLLDDETIRRHVDDYFNKNKLQGESGGSRSQLSQDQARELCSHLHEVTYLYVKEICAYVSARFKVTFSISGMTKWLHQHNFRYKKPQPTPGKVNPVAQKAFIAFYRDLKAKLGSDSPIYFLDSVHPQHQTRIANGWIRKGVRKNIATTGKQKRLSFMGGICLNGHKLVIQQTDKVNADSIKRYLRMLRQRNKERGEIHIVWDNAGYHKSRDILSYAAGLNICVHYLPPYSPNLNPIERLWKMMHEQTLYNKYYEKFADFSVAVCQFFKDISRKKKSLRARITDNFQIVSEPNFAF